MPREFKRSDRVSDAIQKSLAQLIQQEVRDPRVGMVNINSVDVSKDLAVAKVYVTFVGVDSDEENEQSIKVLNSAESYLRSLLAKAITIRTTPKLQFIYDRTQVRSQKLSSLIDKAIASDKANKPREDGSVEDGEGA